MALANGKVVQLQQRRGGGGGGGGSRTIKRPQSWGLAARPTRRKTNCIVPAAYRSNASYAIDEVELMRKYTTHEVERGETISQIAKMYGTTVQEVLDMNALIATDIVPVGLDIFVPRKTPVWRRALKAATGGGDSSDNGQAKVAATKADENRSQTGGNVGVSVGRTLASLRDETAKAVEKASTSMKALVPTPAPKQKQESTKPPPPPPPPPAPPASLPPQAKASVAVSVPALPDLGSAAASLLPAQPSPLRIMAVAAALGAARAAIVYSRSRSEARLMEEEEARMMEERAAQEQWSRWNNALAADREYFADADPMLRQLNEESDAAQTSEDGASSASASDDLEEVVVTDEERRRMQAQYDKFLRKGARADTTQLSTPDDDYSAP